jgi:Zn-dependent protease with chaperone function
MFLPIKKNLQIGIGLMNSLTQDELKAVLAHEFGHFSQKSMKIGSYVYYANQVIHNLYFKMIRLDL